MTPPDPLRHEDDGEGGCLVCREWTGADDVFNRIPFPCPIVRLAALRVTDTLDVDLDTLAVDLGQTHDHEIGVHDSFERVFRAQAEALVARGWRRAALHVTDTPARPAQWLGDTRLPAVTDTPAPDRLREALKRWEQFYGEVETYPGGERGCTQLDHGDEEYEARMDVLAALRDTPAPNLDAERLADALRFVGCDCAASEGFTGTHGDDDEFVAALAAEYVRLRDTP